MIKRIYNTLKLVRAKYRFLKFSEVDSNVRFSFTANCMNSGVKSNVKIGSHSFIACNIITKFGGKVCIGKNVYIGGSTTLMCRNSINIADNVIIANNVIIMDNNNHPTAPSERLKMSMCDDYIKDELWSWKNVSSKPVSIEENVWIGRDVRILKGVTVGKGSIIALGSIVTHDVPPYSIVAGNPARVVKTLNPLEEDR